MSEIRNTAAALMEAERMLTTRAAAGDGSGGLWVSVSVAPLAAILLSTADPGTSRIDLGRARATAAVTVAAPGCVDQPSWMQAALRCPDLSLGEALARALAMDVRQRDSIKAVMVEALNR